LKYFGLLAASAAGVNFWLVASIPLLVLTDKKIGGIHRD